MNDASVQSILAHISSRLRARDASNKELDNLLDAVEQFNVDCDSRIDSFSNSLDGKQFDTVQNRTLQRNIHLLTNLKQRLSLGIDMIDDPNVLFGIVKGHVKSLSLQMKAIFAGGYDDCGLIAEGDALLKYMESFSPDDVAQCWLVR